MRNGGGDGNVIYNRTAPEKNLPDCYAKGRASNNYKLLDVEKDAMDAVRGQLSASKADDDIFEATGRALDLYGSFVGQPRGAATDSQYRYLITTKIAQNRSNGDHENIVSFLCMAFQCDPDVIYLRDGTDTCTVELLGMPLSVLVHAGITADQAVALVQRMMPACITISANFDGTFEFADAEDEYDATAGFSEAEGGDIGGYFGALGATA